MCYLCSMIVARVDRMKEAKTEAEQIIAAYRAEMEAAYKSKADSVIFILFMLFCVLSHSSSLQNVLFSSISKRVPVDQWVMHYNPPPVPKLPTWGEYPSNKYYHITCHFGRLSHILSNPISCRSISRDFSSRRAAVEQMLIDLVVKVEPKATEARGFVRA